MKIAHLIPQFYPVLGGAEICVHSVCQSLAAAGHEAVVVTTTPPPDSEPPLPYTIIRLSRKTGGMFRRLPVMGRQYLLWRLAALQKAHRFDLWQVTMGYYLGVHAVDFFQQEKIPCVLRCCGEDIQTFPEINYGYRLDPTVDEIVKRQYPKFDGFVALTPSVRDEYLALGVNPEKIKIIPNGVDLDRFRRTPPNQSMRKSLAGQEGKLILTVGRYHPKKGFDLIPEIAKALKEKKIPFTWLLVGRENDALAAKYPQLGSLGIHIITNTESGNSADSFSLPSTALVELYKTADVFAFPTLLETFGMVLVEAMAAGLPIVTTDAPGVRDVITDGVDGVKVKAGAVHAFADALADVLTNPRRAAALAAGSRNAAVRYDWKTVTNSYLDFYQEVARSKGVSGQQSVVRGSWNDEF